ncbi:Re/Si-specific NAD(P)(+) transhydrogenase subunit alpha [Zooshikella ganghwensis]|uniref:Re/Si-specific NAD(P)(+) transhydrogenase subunit alpha n=1 Tax=Zooshikella ganghwensis TaxID=202772 RepID=UPI0003FA4F98|nr:Re/Si-specific NAD(P)(+) transhydrogenase subunit alpha [Zooshikella ganghwensis]
MLIGIPKEIFANETRVAATPKTVQQLIKLGFTVCVAEGAGKLASFTDSAYEEAGASIVSQKEAWQAEIIFKVNAPQETPEDEISYLKPGQTLVSFIWPAQNESLLEKLAAKGINVLAMDAVPRISRAQALDALSSMANIAGYRAVVEASHQFGRFFTGQITAAGKVPAAKVLVIGAGVAGLAAVGTASSLGAIVRAFDTRPEVKEQVESMGGEFLELHVEEDGSSTDGYAKEMSEAFIKAEMELFSQQAAEVDIIITTALIPGKPAPKLITADMVKLMKPGSVVVDLAAATGGNCELTQADQLVTTDNDVRIIGYTDLPGRLPNQSSQLYSTNLVNLTKLLCPHQDGNISINFDDQVIRSVTVVKEGNISWPPPPVKVSAQPQPKAQEAVAPVEKAPEPKSSKRKHIALAVGALVFGWIASAAPAAFLSHFTVFVLACIVGYHVIWNVTHALHTPLMSVTNAISGIIIVGALLQVSSDNGLVWFFSAIAVLIATINIFGGFFVTQRMLKMFRK